jgi:putative phosphoesterase
MKIGIVSDTHNRYARVERALELLQQRGIELLLHCGDIEDPETVRLFAGVPTHFVFGNCDTDRGLLRLAMNEVGATPHEPFGKLELAGRRIAWLHGHDQKLFHDLASGEGLDYLFHGHTHLAGQSRRGRTLVVNPGALHRVATKTCAVLDLATGELETLTID